MKTPIYESTPGALMALMFPSSGIPANPAFVFADCYTVTLSSGPILRYTTADMDIGYPDANTLHTFSSKAIRFDYEKSKATAHWKVGMDIDNWQVVVFPRPRDDITGAPYPDTIGGQPFLAACVGGMLDAATVLIDRAYFSEWPAPTAGYITPVGVLPIFAGRIAEVDVGRSGAVLNINSHMELLVQQMPRNLYQAGCQHTLFDSGCQLSALTYRQLDAAGAGSTQSIIKSNLSAPATSSGTFTLGRLQFTTGANAGFGRAIRSWTPGTFTLIAPFTFPVAQGDQFYVWPGCDKQMATCTAFNNLANFGGTPFIPAPEVAT